MSSNTVLYQYWRSSASWRVRWALTLKGVAFESVPVNIAHGEQHDKTYRTRNPMGHVPALVIDGHTLAESVAILEYLEETRPEPRLYPREPWLRARVRQVIEIVNSGIQPLQNLVVIAKVSPDADAQRAWMQHFNVRGLDALEALLLDVDRESGVAGPFAVGTTLTAADLFVVPQISAAKRFGVDMARYPRTMRAYDAAMATEHAAAALPERQPGAPATKA